MEPAKLREDDYDNALGTTMSTIPEDESFFGDSSKLAKPSTPDDALSTELLVNVLDCRKPFLSFEEFYNEPLSDAIKMDNDYLNYKNRKVGTYQFSWVCNGPICNISRVLQNRRSLVSCFIRLS